MSDRSHRVQIYGAVGRVPPQSGLGDIHGLIRLVCLGRNRHAARGLMLKSGLVSSIALLEPSRSYIERTLCVSPDAVYVCPLVLMYMSADHYRPVKARAAVGPGPGSELRLQSGYLR